MMIKLAEGWDRAAPGRAPWWLEPRAFVVHCCCAALLAASGCTTMRPVEPPSGSASWQGVEPGETVLVSLRDGRELELSFVDWTSEGLTGTDELGILQKIERDEIATVEVERYSTARSIGLGVAVVAFLGGIAAAAASDSFDY